MEGKGGGGARHRKGLRFRLLPLSGLNVLSLVAGLGGCLGAHSELPQEGGPWDGPRGAVGWGAVSTPVGDWGTYPQTGKFFSISLFLVKPKQDLLSPLSWLTDNPREHPYSVDLPPAPNFYK